MQANVYTIWEDKNWVIKGEYHESVPNLVVIHCDVHNWSLSLCKDYLDIWENILRDLGARGVTKLGIIVANDDDKLIKFSSMFGFGIECETYFANVPSFFMSMDLG